MSVNTSMLHVRVDADIKAQASENLANFGLTLSDAVRIVLTRVAKEGALPAGLMTDPETYDAWFRAKVHEALDDPTSTIAHDQVMQDAKALISKKRRARA
jgi:DNA-damage-inducible protein J